MIPRGTTRRLRAAAFLAAALLAAAPARAHECDGALPVGATIGRDDTVAAVYALAFNHGLSCGTHSAIDNVAFGCTTTQAAFVYKTRSGAFLLVPTHQAMRDVQIVPMTAFATDAAAASLLVWQKANPKVPPTKQQRDVLDDPTSPSVSIDACAAP